jgi:hypothetical protein
MLEALLARAAQEDLACDEVVDLPGGCWCAVMRRG